MDPYEERLRDEVIYLHSLWHQGPPSRRPSKPNPNPIPVSRTSNRFKKQLHRHGHKHPSPPAQQAYSAEWPVDTRPTKSPPPWSPHAPTAHSAPTPEAGSQKQQAKLPPGRMQWEFLDTFRKFLGITNGENHADNNRDEDEDDAGVVAVEECREYAFFLEVFVNNAQLREYFEKHYEKGEFWCFACVKNKKFKSCHSLLQHAITVSKTAWKRAHKALALVVCRVLGWDLERLPVIELKGQPLSQSLLAPLSAVGDGNGAESDRSAGKENQVDGHGSFETLLDTDVGSAIGEATEVGADATDDANRNQTDGKVDADAVEMHKDKDEVVSATINSGNNGSGGSAEIIQ
ncbi:hypothetical protein MLD38_012648 [Melastoma candidum]|uniref:Uncharacterized protein n=1 Tax=Melastoma candidum TaxID=119954 RepID=A0ACB9R8U3_9MYRT|nr:hypothetical protein MLD38_012648 [Melastoma candidum]